MDKNLKRNVFVAYTPFHVLLAIGIASADKKSENHLLVVRNFADSENLLSAVNEWGGKPFNDVISFPGEQDFEKYSKIKRQWNRYYTIRECCLGILKYSIEHRINNFYLCNEERPQSLCLLNYIKRNKNLKAFYVEDGAITYNTYFAKKGWNYLLFGKLFYGHWWNDVAVMGTSEIFDSIKVLYPKFVRPELKHKRVEKIDLSGVFEFSRLNHITNYLTKYELPKETFNNFDGIILLPNSAILNKETEYKEIVTRLIQYFCSKELRVAVKYHPRDANIDFLGLRELDNVYILNPAIPVEFIFLAPHNNLKFVISDSSTTLMSALWALNGRKIISLGELTSRKDFRFNDVLKSLGVLMPKSFKDLQAVIV